MDSIVILTQQTDEKRDNEKSETVHYQPTLIALCKI